MIPIAQLLAPVLRGSVTRYEGGKEQKWARNQTLTALSGPERDRVCAAVERELDGHAEYDVAAACVGLVDEHGGAAVHAADVRV